MKSANWCRPARSASRHSQRRLSRRRSVTRFVPLYVLNVHLPNKCAVERRPNYALKLNCANMNDPVAKSSGLRCISGQKKKNLKRRALGLKSSIFFPFSLSPNLFFATRKKCTNDSLADSLSVDAPSTTHTDPWQLTSRAWRRPSHRTHGMHAWHGRSTLSEELTCARSRLGRCKAEQTSKLQTDWMILASESNNNLCVTSISI